MRRLLCTLAVVAVSASCGGSPSNSLAPSPAPSAPAAPSNVRPAGTVVSVVSLASEQPVAGANLTAADGQTFHGDDSGRITLTSALTMGQVVTITAPGYLARRTILRNHVAFNLWPRTDAESGLTEDFTKDVVYGGDCGRNAPRRLLRLHPSVTRVYLAPTPDIMEQTERPQPWAMPAREAHERAVAELNRVLAPAVRFELVSRATAPTSGFVIPVSVGPTAHTCTAAAAFASYSFLPPGDIIGGDVTHCGLTTPENDVFGTANLPSVVLHEVGHILGLSHSSGLGDAMFTGACPAPLGSFRAFFEDTYSSRERQALLMMRQRSAGNAFPDDDSTIPGLALATGGSRTVIVH